VLQNRSILSWVENSSPSAELIRKHNLIIITINDGTISIDKKYCKTKKNGIKNLVISKNVVNGIKNIRLSPLGVPKELKLL